MEEVTLTSPGAWQPSDDTDSQKPGKQWVGTKTRPLLPLAESTSYQASLQQPLGAAILLHIGNCIRSTGCSGLSTTHIDTLQTNELRPWRHSHPLLRILISFAWRSETRLVRKGTQISVILLSGSTTVPSCQKSDIFIPFFVCFEWRGVVVVVLVVPPPSLAATSVIFTTAGDVTGLHLAAWELCD